MTFSVEFQISLVRKECAKATAVLLIFNSCHLIKFSMNKKVSELACFCSHGKASHPEIKI